jgi:hypothetical protein
MHTTALRSYGGPDYHDDHINKYWDPCKSDVWQAKAKKTSIQTGQENIQLSPNRNQSDAPDGGVQGVVCQQQPA